MQCLSRREYQANPGCRPKKTEMLLEIEALANGTRRSRVTLVVQKKPVFATSKTQTRRSRLPR
jgi:hypothetical protein